MSPGCAAINRGDFDISGLTAVSATLAFEAGEIVTAAWNVYAQFDFILGPIIFNASNSSVGSRNFTVPSTGLHFISTSVQTGNATLTCTPVAAAQADSQAVRLALFQPYYFQFSPESLPGVPIGADPTASVDIGHVFEFSGMGVERSAPWPAIGAAFGDEPPVQDIAASGQSQMTLGGVPVNVWGRAKGTLYSGTLGRNGGQGHGLLGAAFGVDENVDLGIFGHILGGSIRSGVLNASMDSLIGGIGAYTMVKRDNRVRIGLSASVSWGSHLLQTANASGRFGTTHFTVDASLARPYEVGDFVVTPMALLAFHHVTFGAFTDTAGTMVPSMQGSRLKIGGMADIAYPVTIDGDYIKRIVPRFNVRVDFHALRGSAFQVAPGLIMQPSLVTVDLSTGVDVALQNGGNLDLAIGVTELASNLVGYSIRGQFRVPLN